MSSETRVITYLNNVYLYILIPYRCKCSMVHDVY